MFDELDIQLDLDTTAQLAAAAPPTAVDLAAIREAFDTGEAPGLPPVNEHLDGKLVATDGSLHDPAELAFPVTAEEFHATLVNTAVELEPAVIFEDMNLQAQLESIDWGRLAWTAGQFWDAAGPENADSEGSER